MGIGYRFTLAVLVCLLLLSMTASYLGWGISTTDDAAIRERMILQQRTARLGIDIDGGPRYGK
ncbi:MAG: hypothetical protein SFU56_10380 [Capsulimonadales bacterium]|nr:hypothetical protein [Capsulimonadales bacterium]